jgi:hypothetical protein
VTHVRRCRGCSRQEDRLGAGQTNHPNRYFTGRNDHPSPGGAVGGSPAVQPFDRPVRPRRPSLIGCRLRIGHFLPPGGKRMTTSQTDTNSQGRSPAGIHDIGPLPRPALDPSREMRPARRRRQPNPHLTETPVCRRVNCRQPTRTAPGRAADGRPPRWGLSALWPILAFFTAYRCIRDQNPIRRPAERPPTLASPQSRHQFWSFLQPIDVFETKMAKPAR